MTSITTTNVCNIKDMRNDPVVISKEGISLLFGDHDHQKNPINVNIDTEQRNNTFGDNTNHNKSTNFRLKRCLIVTKRIFILLTGIFLGLLTFVPNAMMSDSGTPDAIKMSILCMFASLLFIIGGIVGCIYNRWMTLLPGLFVQFSPFILGPLLGANATIIVNVIVLVAYCRYVRL